MPYKLSPDYIYLLMKRGDSIIAPTKEKEYRWFDGMLGFIDPKDWSGPVELSDYYTGEVAIIKVNRDWKPLAVESVRHYEANGPGVSGFRESRGWIDPKQLAPLVDPQIPDFLTKYYIHKGKLPMVDGTKLSPIIVKDTRLIDPKRAVIPDVGQVTTGTFQVGPGGGDHYPTFGGAGGAWAAAGNLTGNLTFQHNTGNINEIAQAVTNIDLNGFTLLNENNTPPVGDPTVGFILQENFGGNHFFLDQAEGPGAVDFKQLYIQRQQAKTNAVFGQIVDFNIIAAHDKNVYGCLLDGGNFVGSGIVVGDVTPFHNHWNNMIWQHVSNGIHVFNPATNGFTENNSVWDCGIGINGNARFIFCRNNASWDCVSDYGALAAATGRYNLSSDLTAVNANWAVGVANITNTAAAICVQSVNPALAAFLDILDPGSLVDAGEANAIAARTTCVRGRPVPNSNAATSIGAAETPTPTPPPPPSGRNFWNANRRQYWHRMSSVKAGI